MNTDQIAAEHRRQILDALNIHDDMKLGYDPLFASERVDVIIKAAIEKALAQKDELHAAALTVLERHHKAACEKARHEGYLEGHKVASDFARTVQEERSNLSRAAQASKDIGRPLLDHISKKK